MGIFNEKDKSLNWWNKNWFFLGTIAIVIVNVILFAFLVYVTIKANDILSFFKDYINLNGNIEVIAGNYFNNKIVISIIIIIVFSIIIYLLMKYKKKPRLLYIIIIITSILSLVAFIYLYTNLKELEISSMTGREIRLLRDISRFNFLGLLILCIPIIIRGLGFDIKKFNFTKEIADLKLEKEDNEEVEVNIDLNSDSIKRSGRKLRRELKYYYVENKVIITKAGIIIHK